jgi:ribonuclease G
VSVELVINSSPSEVIIALLNDGELVELHREKSNNNFSVGDIYLGKVKKIMSGLNAAFVDVGYEKDAFLHYLDLGPQFKSLQKYVKLVQSGKMTSGDLSNFELEPELDKNGKIGDVLKSNQNILVQIAKEPISTKGPRLSSELSIAGRYLVLIPFSDKVSVSQKIKSEEERHRLKNLISSIKPKGFGIIIRTVAENKKVADLHNDMNYLTQKWNEGFKRLKNAKPPAKIIGELDRTSAMLRDLLNADFNQIHVNDEALYGEIKSYLHTIAPDKEKIVKLYSGSKPIFDHFGIEKQIKALFGKNVSMRSGAYLIVEHTEAMHVIDVNSGQRGVKKGDNQEQNALAVNIEAAKEVARQLRLRDMGGIIVVDFIDMREEENRMTLYHKLKEFMKEDRAKHSILPPSKFGLIEITRQRVRPEMDVEVTEKCPCCKGKGEVQSTILFVDEIENTIRYLAEQTNQKKLKVRTHPYIAAFINRPEGLLKASLRKKWEKDYKCQLVVEPITSYSLLEYHVFDKNDDEIIL